MTGGTMEPVRIADIPLETLANETWEGTLRRLTADMDPWDIDVGELARRYREMLRAMHELRFEIPGRMVLTCSVLLRMKSDELLASARPRSEFIAELEEAVDEAAEEWDAPIEPDEEFVLPLRRRPRRRVTLTDLRAALAAALKVDRRRAARRSLTPDDDEDIFDYFELGGEDITSRLQRLFTRIKKLLSGRKAISFFQLLERGDKEERVSRFVEVLHLAAQGEIICEQEEFLGDIVIKLTAAE